MTLRDTADWIIKPRLLAVPGVAHVIVFGGAVRQIQILPDVQQAGELRPHPRRRVGCRARGAAAARRGIHRHRRRNASCCGRRRRRRTSTRSARRWSPCATARPSCCATSREVKFAPALRSGDALIMGKPGVLLSLASQYGANTLTTTLAVEKALADLRARAEGRGITLYSGLHRPGQLHRARARRSEAIAADRGGAHSGGAVPVPARLARGALIAFTAIPLSLLAAVAVLDRMGLTLNTMTLGGFAVALGVLVDDAIIGIENILRRLRENAPLPQPTAAARCRARGLARSARPGDLCHRGGHRGVPAGIVHLQRAGPFRRAAGAGLHLRGAGLAARGDDLDAGAVRAVAAQARRTARGALAAAPQDPGRRRGARRGHALQGRRRAACCAWWSAPMAALPFLGGTFMPDFREGHFVHAGVEFHPRHLAR